MRKVISIVISLILLCSLPACAVPNEVNGENELVVSTPIIVQETAQPEETALPEDDMADSNKGAEYDSEKEDTSMDVRITVNGANFLATLNDSEAAKELYAILPLSLDMSEMNGNEKYCRFPESFSAEDESVGSIETGDIMLYGNNTLVLFYDSFPTSYSYTPLGKIRDTDGLKEALGSEDVTVTFAAESAIPVFDFEEKTVMLNDGNKMPILGLGTYSLLDDECVDSVTEVLQFGGRLIDTAYMYHNETAVGEGVRASGVPREDVFVTTKLYPNQFENAEAAIDEALEKLNIEYIDLMLLHHPGDGDVEAYKAMEQAVAVGKIRSIGLSNWYVEELQEFLPQITIMPAVVQNEIHPYYQENDVIPYVQGLGIVTEGWYPLGGRGHTAELLGDATITDIAKTHGVSSAQVILRWNLQKGVVTIPGSSNPEHIKENLDIFGFELTNAEMTAINALNRDEKHDWY